MRDPRRPRSRRRAGPGSPARAAAVPATAPQRTRAARPRRPCDDGGMRITGAESTLLFAGTVAHPLQIMRVTLADLPATGPVVVRAEGPGVRTPPPFRIEDPVAGATRTAE